MFDWNKSAKNSEPPDLQIPKIPSSQLSYDRFFCKFMQQNQPVVITEVSDKWCCSRNWIENTENYEQNKINFKYLKQKIPNRKVPIADCSVQCSNSHEKIQMDFYDFLDYWQERQSAGNSTKLLYLKDWHLRNEMPNYDFYTVPLYFKSDWLNEYLTETGQDDYRFVYMGPEGTWTPFHSDVFGSFSWSTNICGNKKWIFLRPGEENKLLDRFGNVPFSIDASELSDKNVQYYEIVQNPGESLFVPTGWYHQVWNLADTISINHNWFNGTNIQQIWQILYENYEKVCQEIADCRSMDAFEKHCQIMLKASHGMNFQDLLNLLKLIAKNRKCQLNAIAKSMSNGISGNQCQYDLKQIEIVVKSIWEKCQNFDEINEEILNNCEEIREIIG